MTAHARLSLLFAFASAFTFPVQSRSHESNKFHHFSSSAFTKIYFKPLHSFKCKKGFFLIDLPPHTLPFICFFYQAFYAEASFSHSQLIDPIRSSPPSRSWSILRIRSFEFFNTTATELIITTPFVSVQEIIPILFHHVSFIAACILHLPGGNAQLVNSIALVASSRRSIHEDNYNTIEAD